VKRYHKDFSRSKNKGYCFEQCVCTQSTLGLCSSESSFHHSMSTIQQESRCISTLNIDFRAYIECDACGIKHPSKQCAKCKCTFYCSKACQRKHWKEGHKEVCRSLETKYHQDSSVEPNSGVGDLLKRTLILIDFLVLE
jgi:MYND finger